MECFKSRFLSLKKYFSTCPIGSDEERDEFYFTMVRNNIERYGKVGHRFDNSYKLYFADGAIGSGKSTVLRHLILKKKIQHLLFYNPEVYVTVSESQKEFGDAYNDAKAFLWSDAEKRLSTGESLIIESVFTKPEKINFFHEAKELGYTLMGLYVGTSSPYINVRRVALRSHKGGYHVPRKKILDRYSASLENLHRIFSIAYEFVVFDNSGPRASIVAYKHHSHIHVSIDPPAWLRSSLLRYI